MKKSSRKNHLKKKRKWGDAWLPKRSKPDVIYGRDLKESLFHSENIVQEMGEVIIRCQVMDVEAREIRNEKTISDFPGYGFHRLHHSKNVPAQRK